MRCEKLRRIYFKYIDGELSGRKARLLEKHVRDCPACAAEAKSIERVRSLLQTAGQVEMPDAYWDTYWDRLEKKLPDRPSPVPLISRILATLRQPAVLGRAAVYILLLAILIYITPDHPSKITVEVTPGATAPVQAPLRAAEGKFEFQEEMERVGATDSMDLSVQSLSRGRADAGLAEKQAETATLPAEDAKDKELAEVEFGAPTSGAGIAVAEGTRDEMLPRAAPAKPATASEPLLDKSSVAVQDQPKQIVENEEEYVAADSYFREGEYPQAIVSYQNFIVANRRADMNDERMLRAVYQLGEANYQIGNYSEALSNFVAVTNEELPQTFGVEDNHAMRVKTRSEAVSKLEAGRESKEAKSDLRASGSATKGVAALYYDRDQSQDLPKTREGLISRAVFRQAESYEHLGKLKEAATKYKEYVEKYPRGEYVSQAKEKIGQVAR